MATATVLPVLPERPVRVWPVAVRLKKGGSVEITGPDAKHIVTILRLGAGSVIRLSDGDSRLFEARIETARKNVVVAKVTDRLSPVSPRKPEVTLAVSLSKQPVMEIIVQKAVELGCNRFAPVITKRSLYKKLSESKLARLRKIAHEASKQSGNFIPMEVSDPVEPETLPDAELKLLLWEKEKGRGVKSVLENACSPSTLLLMVGPPGGFESDEVQKLNDAGFITAGLGGLVQRTETAAISLMAIVNYHFDRL